MGRGRRRRWDVSKGKVNISRVQAAHCPNTHIDSASSRVELFACPHLNERDGQRVDVYGTSVVAVTNTKSCPAFFFVVLTSCVAHDLRRHERERPDANGHRHHVLDRRSGATFALPTRDAKITNLDAAVIPEEHV